MMFKNREPPKSAENAHAIRESIALQELAALGVEQSDFLKQERRRNSAWLIDSPGLAGLAQVITAAITPCSSCGKPFTITLRLAGRESPITLWLRCCEGGTGRSMPPQPVKSITQY